MAMKLSGVVTITLNWFISNVINDLPNKLVVISDYLN